MAEQVFPYHLAGFAVGALATGYTISSLKQYFTRPVVAKKKPTVDPNLLPPSQPRKRKRDADATSLPATKRRLPNAVNTSLSAPGTISSDDVIAQPLVNSVNATSNSEQASMKITIRNVSSPPSHYIQLKSHDGVNIAFREPKHHTKCGDSYAARSRRHKKVSLITKDSTTENETNEQDYHSDSTVIGDDLEHHDNGSDDSEDQSEKAIRSADRDEEDGDSEDLIGEGPDSETNEEADDDRADHDEKEHGLRDHDEDDDDLEDDKQENDGAHAEAVEIYLHRQNKKMDLKISIPNRRSNNLEIMV